MPNTKSAAKRLKTDAKRNIRNTWARKQLKKREKNLLAMVEEKNVAGAQEALQEMYSQLDRAAKHNVIHQNKVNRKKSRLETKVKELQQQ